MGLIRWNTRNIPAGTTTEEVVKSAPSAPSRERSVSPEPGAILVAQVGAGSEATEGIVDSGPLPSPHYPRTSSLFSA